MLVGIIGCGSIGSYLAEHLPKLGFNVSAIYDSDFGRLEKVGKKTGVKTKRSFEEFLEERMDIVVESASQEALREYAEKILLSGRDLIALSVGAFADRDFYRRISELCKNLGRKVYIAYALAGLDAISAVSDFIEEIEMESRKSRRTVGELKFEGSSFEASKLFPKSMNVATALAIASKRDFKVRFTAGDEEENVHMLRVRWRFGEIEVKVKNKVMEENPRTSFLAVLSVIRILRNIEGGIVV
ncbi:MAG: aspartate dehydrogenase [Archaeoglobaceae archaeon]